MTMNNKNCKKKELELRSKFLTMSVMHLKDQGKFEICVISIIYEIILH